LTKNRGKNRSDGKRSKKT